MTIQTQVKHLNVSHHTILHLRLTSLNAKTSVKKSIVQAMSNHTEAIPAWLDGEYLEPWLKKSLNKPDLKITSININSGSNVGDNYVCRIFRILVKTNGEDISVIAKYKPETTKLLETFKSDWDVFKTECIFFKNLLPTLRYCIAKEDDFAPICYGVDEDKNIILMEDLSAKGYELQKKGVFLNREQCLLTVEAFAVMHGASFYLLRDDPNLKDAFGCTLWNDEGNDIMDKFFLNTQKQLELFVNTYGLSSSYSKKLLGYLEKYKLNKHKVHDLREGKLNFLLHGDCWMNNMLYHFKNNTADAVKLIDYQIINYNCFALDLHQFLFSSAHIDVLINDLDIILEAYFNKLRSVASDIPNLTLDRVKAEFKERAYAGYLYAVSMRPFTGVDEVINFDDVLDGKSVPMGFNNPGFISDLKKLLPYFESVGVF